MLYEWTSGTNMYGLIRTYINEWIALLGIKTHLPACWQDSFFRVSLTCNSQIWMTYLDPTSAHCDNVRWIVGGEICSKKSFEPSLHLWWPLWWVQQRCGSPPPADESRWTGPWQNPLWTHGFPRLASCQNADQMRGQSPGEENSFLGQSGLI